MLGAPGRHPNRPAHIHLIVTAPGFDPLVTHIFAPECQYLAEDAVFGVNDDLIGDLRRLEDRAEAAALGMEAPAWIVEWDFVLAPDATRPDRS